MSKATEEKLVEFVDELIRNMEVEIGARWGEPLTTPAYRGARADFRDALEQRIRYSEFLKEE